MVRGTARWQTLPPHGSRIGNLPELRIPHANAVRRHEVPNCYRSHLWSRSWQAGDSQFWANQISDRLWGRQVTICHKFSGAGLRLEFPAKRGMYHWFVDRNQAGNSAIVHKRFD